MFTLSKMYTAHYAQQLLFTVTNFETLIEKVNEYMWKSYTQDLLVIETRE